uniref:hypothetical protein n=1 Tax=Streptococcus halichoeri TaxID=254785 RepID=UPI001359BF42
KPLVSDIDKKTELSPGLNSVDFKRFSQTKCQFDETGTYFGNLPFFLLVAFAIASDVLLGTQSSLLSLQELLCGEKLS